MAASLRFLADESCDFAVVRALRAEGYDVLAISEVMTRSDDRTLIHQANVEKRILLTEDKDFGLRETMHEPKSLSPNRAPSEVRVSLYFE